MHATRTKIGQKTHDEKLIQRVKENQKLGLKVTADLPGMDKPKPINGMIPDLVALKYGKIRKIEEVETKATLILDKDQHKDFKNKAQELGAVYKTIIAKRKK